MIETTLAQTDDRQKVIATVRVGQDEAKRRLMNRPQCLTCKTVFMNRNIKTCPHCGGGEAAHL